MRGASGLLAPLLALWALACSAAPGPEGAAPSRGARPLAELTILYTSDEHGWFLPERDAGVTVGGAANALARWIAEDEHCPRITRAGPCSRPKTLLLSGGDNYTGPAVSSYFEGAPMAEAMARMGYAASALGNHELDFGSAAFIRNRTLANLPYVAANLHCDASLPAEVKLPSFLVFERRGVRIAVVGLATETTLQAAKATAFHGMRFESEESALARAIPEAWATNPDFVVLIAHECPDVLEPILARHPDWGLTFVGGGHCHRTLHIESGGTPVISPGWQLRKYARVHVKVDAGRAPRSKVVHVDAAIVDVKPPVGPLPEAAAELEAAALRWKGRLDASLGEEIGFASSGLPHKSHALAAWVAETWRETVGADVAVVNLDALRQGLPKGPITLGTIHSILPFNNRLFLGKITGSALAQNLVRTDMIVTGVQRARGGSLVDAKGQALDLQKSYSVVTIDFLYFGGEGSTFHRHDPSPTDTGIDWRTPVIDWLRSHPTSAALPVERHISRPR
jgi:5'-nucleotidase / UDP-sugar diphosphatase